MKNLYEKPLNQFSKEDFAAPGDAYVPVYTWTWNAPVTKEETDKQLLEMQRLGIKCVYALPEPKSFRPISMPTQMEPDYLTEPYFEAFQYAVKKAAELGMTCWLYDEGGWPSGGACGKVLTKNPKLAKKCLGARKVSVALGEAYHASADTIGSFYLDGEPVKDGEILQFGEEIIEYFIETKKFVLTGLPDAPDLLLPESTESFLEITHEAYKPYLEEFFGDKLTAVFFDEPSIPSPIPFRKELEEQFEKENGYSIRPFLPELNGDIEPTEAGEKARIAWFDLCSRLLCQNYLLKEKEWSNKNNLVFTGHMGGEDLPTGIHGGISPVLRMLRCLDMPGIDVIWRQIHPTDEPTHYSRQVGSMGENRFFPRYASSAATQTGVRRTMTECFGVYGAGISFDEMRYILNFQALRGINLYNFFSVPYGREGYLMTGELPYFTEMHACYADLPEFNRFCERLSYVTSLGKFAASVALYMPCRDFWAGTKKQEKADAYEKIGHDLEDARVSFDIFDDDTINLADVKALDAGKIVVGEACYTALVIPPAKHMLAENIEKLERFIRGGGKVFVSEDAELKIDGAVRFADAKTILAPELVLSGETDKVRVSKRIADDGELYLICNESTTNKSFTVEIDERACLLDLDTGKVLAPIRKDGKVCLSLRMGEMACLWISDKIEIDGEVEVFAKEISHAGEFTFRRTNRFIVGDLEFEFEEYNEEAKPISLGDWTGLLGKRFSGSGVYKTSFAAPIKEGEFQIDLGEVHYTCEAFLNGESLGVRIMPPYSYTVDAKTLKAENELEIRVSNTPANEYNHTDSFDKWPAWMLSPYWNRSKVFQRDTESGGLYGPVTFRTK